MLRIDEMGEFEKREFPIQDVKETWEKSFDMDWLTSRPKECSGNFKDHWMQGVAPRITMEQIVKVERFIVKLCIRRIS